MEVDLSSFRQYNGTIITFSANPSVLNNFPITGDARSLTSAFSLESDLRFSHTVFHLCYASMLKGLSANVQGSEEVQGIDQSMSSRHIAFTDIRAFEGRENTLKR